MKQSEIISMLANCYSFAYQFDEKKEVHIFVNPFTGVTLHLSGKVVTLQVEGAEDQEQTIPISDITLFGVTEGAEVVVEYTTTRCIRY